VTSGATILVLRAAILADDDAAYGVTLAALDGLDGRRLDPADRERGQSPVARRGELPCGGWDLSHVRRCGVEELD
jgi:hypothetical protein